MGKVVDKPVRINWTPSASVIRPNILVRTSRPVDLSTLAIIGAFKKDIQITAVTIAIAIRINRCVLISRVPVEENRIMVDMVPGPVVSGIPIGIMAVEITFDKLVFSTGDSELTGLTLIIEKPVLRSSSPPAIRNAGIPISKKFRTATPVKSETTIVTNDVKVAILHTFKCCLGVKPLVRARKRGIAATLFAVANRAST
nr:hypothetical protein [Geomonas subterranea]